MTSLHSALIVLGASGLFAAAFNALGRFVAARGRWIPRRRVPWVAIALLTVTLAVNLWQRVDSDLVGSLGRNPGDLGHGYLWKLASPLLIQSDGTVQFVSNTAYFVVIVPLNELVLGPLAVLALYLAGGLAGQAAGFALDPHGGGDSVAIAGVLGGLFVLPLLDARASRGHRLVGLVGLASGLLLAVAPDNHGVALLAGGLAGWLLFRGGAWPRRPRAVDGASRPAIGGAAPGRDGPSAARQ